MFSPLRRKRASLLLLCALSLALFGCGTSRTTAPAPISQPQANEVAQQVAFLVMLSPDMTSVPSSASAPVAFADSRGLNMHRGRVGSPSRVRGESDVAWTFDATWYDAAGGEQVAYDSATTARVVTHQTGRGTYSDVGFTATLGHSAVVDLSGLLAAATQVSVTATRSDTLQANYSGQDGEAQLTLRCTGGLAQVTRDKPLTENPYPASGSASWSVDGHRAAQTPNGSFSDDYEVTVSVTFNGTRYVPLVVDGRFQYLLDLETGVVTPVSV